MIRPSISACLSCACSPALFLSEAPCWGRCYGSTWTGQAQTADLTECPRTILLWPSQGPTLPCMPTGSETCGAVPWTEGTPSHAGAEAGCFVGTWDKIGLKKLTSLWKVGTTAGGPRKGLSVTTGSFVTMPLWVSQKFAGWFLEWTEGVGGGGGEYDLGVLPCRSLGCLCLWPVGLSFQVGSPFTGTGSSLGCIGVSAGFGDWDWLRNLCFRLVTHRVFRLIWEKPAEESWWLCFSLIPILPSPLRWYSICKLVVQSIKMCFSGVFFFFLISGAKSFLTPISCKGVLETLIRFSDP